MHPQGMQLASIFLLLLIRDPSILGTYLVYVPYYSQYLQHLTSYVMAIAENSGTPKALLKSGIVLLGGGL